MKRINFNVNHYVRVKLTKKGHEIMENNHHKLWEKHPKPPIFETPKVDEDGWTRFQLWVLMEEFGEYLHNGFGNAFETEIQFEIERTEDLT